MSKVTVYSTTWCGFCKMAKEYFKSKNVAFDDINVEEDRAAAEHIVKKTGQMGVPVIEIGNYTIIGFDRPHIDMALQAEKLI